MFKMIFQATAVFGLALGTTMIAPTEPVQAASFKKSCGGLNQKSCVHVNPKKWCKAGLTYKPRIGKRGICIKKVSKPKPKPKPCGGLNQNSCVSPNPKKWCNAGLTYKPRIGRRGTCVIKPPKPACGGLNQNSCFHVNPAKWCNTGLSYKPNMLRGKRGTCIKKVRNSDRIAVAKTVIEEIGDNNPLANLTKCLNRSHMLNQLKDAMKDRSRNGVNRLLRACGTSHTALRDMGNLPALNAGTSSGANVRSAGGGSGGYFKTLTITVGGSGAAWVAGSASTGIAIELKKSPNARWFFTGGVGAGPKAEVVGDVTVGLSRSTIPTSRVGSDHGTSAVVSGHYIVGLSGGVDFAGNTLGFDGISFGAGGGVGVGGAVYKTGAVYPFKDY